MPLLFSLIFVALVSTTAQGQDLRLVAWNDTLRIPPHPTDAPAVRPTATLSSQGNQAWQGHSDRNSENSGAQDSQGGAGGSGGGSGDSSGLSSGRPGNFGDGYSGSEDDRAHSPGSGLNGYSSPFGSSGGAGAINSTPYGELDFSRATPAGNTMSFLSQQSIHRTQQQTSIFWNGCDKSKSKIQAGSDYRTCQNHIELNEEFAQQLDRFLLPCAQSAATRAGVGQISNLFINKGSTYEYRGKIGCSNCGSQLSEHAYARAMDINGFQVTTNQGIFRFGADVASYNRSRENRIFYDQFRACWAANTPQTCRWKSQSIGIPGSSLGGNAAHNSHIHLQLGIACGKAAGGVPALASAQ